MNFPSNVKRIIILSILLGHMCASIFADERADSDFDPGILRLYNDFKKAKDSVVDFREFRPKNPEGWVCDITSAAPGDLPITFTANLLTDVKFGGRQLRLRVEGVERKDLDGSLGLTYGDAVTKNPYVYGMAARENVSDGFKEEKYSVRKLKPHLSRRDADALYGSSGYDAFFENVTEYDTVAVSYVRASHFCLRRMGGELLVEVSASYQVLKRDTKTNTLYPRSTNLRLSPEEIEMRKYGKPSLCIKDQVVEYLMSCE